MSRFYGSLCIILFYGLSPRSFFRAKYSLMDDYARKAASVQHEHCILTYFQLLDIAKAFISTHFVWRTLRRHSLAHICVASHRVTAQLIHLVWRWRGRVQAPARPWTWSRIQGGGGCKYAGVPPRLEFQAILLSL